MFKNYLKTAVRNFARHMTHTIINLFGLITGMVCTLLILLYVNYEMSFDEFQANKKNLYRVNKVAYDNGKLNYKSAFTFSGQGPVMKSEVPEVVDYVRFLHSEGVIKYTRSKDYLISSRVKDVYYADSTFFNIFSCRLLYGNSQSVLSRPNSIVLSESAAKKIFDSENPIGKVVKYAKYDLIVTGIYKDVPQNTHLNYSALISFNTLKISDQESWTNHSYYTYILLKENADPSAVEPKLAKAFDKFMYKYYDRKFVTNYWNLQRVDRIYLYSTDFTSISMEYGSYKTVLYLFIVAFLVLVIAWANFINHSIARLPDRAKELGIRKTIGASRKQLIKQFLTEAVIINLAAVVISIIIVASSVKYLNQFLGINISMFQAPNNLFWGAWILLLLTGVFLTSVYPAIWLSSIPTTSALNKKLSRSIGGSILRKTLITFQFSISIALMIITIVIYKQITFTRNKDLGLDINNVLIIRATDYSEQGKTSHTFEQFKQIVAANPVIRNVSFSLSIPGERFGFGSYGSIYREGLNEQNNYFRIGKVDPSFIDLFRIKLLAGSNFTNESDNLNKIIINKEAMKVFGFGKAADAVDSYVRWNGRLLKIIGVIDNFHQESFHKTVEPIVLYVETFDQITRYISIKFGNGDNANQLAYIENTYKFVFPGQPFDCFFLDDYFHNQYKTDIQTGKLILGFALLAIIIAVLGLFSLMSYSTVKRTKEVGIRKVVGATIFDVVSLLTKDFIKWVLVANIIAWPIAYYLMNKWLQDFAYRIDISWWMFVLSGGIALVIAFVTISFLAIKAAVANPVESLRYD